MMNLLWCFARFERHMSINVSIQHAFWSSFERVVITGLRNAVHSWIFSCIGISRVAFSFGCGFGSGEGVQIRRHSADCVAAVLQNRQPVLELGLHIAALI